jgi:hypothetical protein
VDIHQAKEIEKGHLAQLNLAPILAERIGDRIDSLLKIDHVVAAPCSVFVNKVATRSATRCLTQ